MNSTARVIRKGTAAGSDPALAALVLLVAGIWLTAAFLGGVKGLFDAGPERPPLPILIAFVVPLAVFGLAYLCWPRFREFTLALDLRLLTAVQSWRVLGGMFVFLWALDLRPALFALPAGLGDVAVGVAAVFVVRAMTDETPGWQRQVLWLNLGGMLDFVGAFSTGILTSNSSLGVFAGEGQWVSMAAMPLSLIPTFAVPFWTILHLISLLQLRAMKRNAIWPS